MASSSPKKPPRALKPLPDETLGGGELRVLQPQRRQCQAAAKVHPPSAPGMKIDENRRPSACALT